MVGSYIEIVVHWALEQFMIRLARLFKIKN